MCAFQQEVLIRKQACPCFLIRTKSQTHCAEHMLLINSHIFQPCWWDWIENANYNFIGHANKHDVDQEKVQ